MKDGSVVIIALDEGDKLDEILNELDKSILVLTNSNRKMSEVVKTMLNRRGEVNE